MDRILAIRNKKAIRRAGSLSGTGRSPRGHSRHRSSEVVMGNAITPCCCFSITREHESAKRWRYAPRNLQLEKPRQVRLLGKGRKERICPLWPETASALHRIIHVKKRGGLPLQEHSRGAPLTRDGVAYLLRKYVHLAAQHAPALRKRTSHSTRHAPQLCGCAPASRNRCIRDTRLSRSCIGGHYKPIHNDQLQMKRDVLEAFWKRAGLDPTAPESGDHHQSCSPFLESL